jgi:hypothetical protein
MIRKLYETLRELTLLAAVASGRRELLLVYMVLKLAEELDIV